MDKIRDRLLVEKNIKLKLSPQSEEHIVKAGYDPCYGARPIKRFLQKNVETLIAKAILSDEISDGDECLINYTDNKFNIQKSQIMVKLKYRPVHRFCLQKI